MSRPDKDIKLGELLTLEEIKYILDEHHGLSLVTSDECVTCPRCSGWIGRSLQCCSCRREYVIQERPE